MERDTENEEEGKGYGNHGDVKSEYKESTLGERVHWIDKKKETWRENKAIKRHSLGDLKFDKKMIVSLRVKS